MKRPPAFVRVDRIMDGRWVRSGQARYSNRAERAGSTGEPGDWGADCGAPSPPAPRCQLSGCDGIAWCGNTMAGATGLGLLSSPR